MDAPILKVIPQRHAMDCGVACLAMLCGVSYENALVAVAIGAPNVCVAGAYVTDLQKAARRLGYSLRARKRFDAESDTGILDVICAKWAGRHFVVLREGLVVDTDGTLWDSDVFQRIYNAKLGPLYVLEKS